MGPIEILFISLPPWGVFAAGAPPPPSCKCNSGAGYCGQWAGEKELSNEPGGLLCLCQHYTEWYHDMWVCITACQKSIAPWGAGRWEMGRLGKQSSTGLSQSPGLFPLNPSYHIPTTEEEMLSCLMSVFREWRKEGMNECLSNAERCGK